MKTIRDALLFIFANLIGFMAAPITYNASVLSGWFSPTIIEADPAAFQASFFSGIMITWVFCGLFSFGFFIARSKVRLLFLLLPALIPAIYGLSVLNEFSASP